MRVAEQPRGGMTKDLVGDLLVAIGAFADGEIAAPALIAFPANDREGDNDPIANLELRVLWANLDHLAHEFMAEDVSRFHARYKAVVKVQVGAADRTARHSDDRIVRIFDA